MVYCAECVKSNYCIDMRKDRKDSIACNKYKDHDYNNSFRDGDCDSIQGGIFGGLRDCAYGSDGNRKFRDVENLVNR